MQVRSSGVDSERVNTLDLSKPVAGSKIKQRSGWLKSNWIVPVTGFLGLYACLPFLAPVFMQLGWETPARLIYALYSTQCHQLPQRSFFLFGAQGMYSLPDVQAAWQETINPLLLRQFIGNVQMGWKVAWSDRMVSMYVSAFIFALLWWIFRHHIGRLPWWGFALLLLPMTVDGTTHFISDFSGLGQGFRDQNLWLVQLTHNAFPGSFYGGDALGSFNSWMRLISGMMFGLGLVWFSFPYLDEIFRGQGVN
jgi:uncharacterized membrane protein